ncbi:MAG: hypothetical protein ACHQ7M_01745 [Chloroflexota bacterium]
MPSKKRTLSVRLDPAAERRVECAAGLQRMSRGAFLEHAGEDAARRVLLDWAVSRYRDGEQTFSELAEQTGLEIESIMEAVTEHDGEAGLRMFLASCRSLAAADENPEFLRLAEQAVAALQRGRKGAAR